MKQYLVIIILLFAAGVSAQTECDYYKGKESVTAGGITYKVDYEEINGGRVKAVVALSNAANVYDNEVNLRYNDGRALQTEEEYASIEASSDNHAVIRYVRECFGDVQISMLRSYPLAPLTIEYVIAPDGTTLEVSFVLTGIDQMLSIQPSVFAKLEKKLKTLKWEVNDFGKQLRFIHASGFINFKYVPLSSELAAIEKNDDSLGSDLVPLE